jgi:adenosylcobinamide kinase/adenosylcobinamide-phosphate guanylyltransferase
MFGEVAMGKIILVTGGSRSGKSTFAEKLLEDKDDVLYIATAIVTDKEMEKRVENHRNRRNPKWGTYEGYKALDKAFENGNYRYIMLECIGTMVTNLMFEQQYNFDNMSQQEIDELTTKIKSEVEKMIFAVKQKDKELIIVTNEVGWSLVSEYKLGRIFSDILGHLNQLIASLSDEVYLVACGLPIRLK